MRLWDLLGGLFLKDVHQKPYEDLLLFLLERTRDLLQRINPIPYFAPYFGYKVHMDQNEKIGQRYGCTHVALIDGCSRMIVGYVSMPVKNPIIIYEFVFRPALVKCGLWNQLRVDHGQEFVLCIYIQDLIKRYRYSEEKAPWRQTASTTITLLKGSGLN